VNPGLQGLYQRPRMIAHKRFCVLAFLRQPIQLIDKCGGESSATALVEVLSAKKKKRATQANASGRQGQYDRSETTPASKLNQSILGVPNTLKSELAPRTSGDIDRISSRGLFVGEELSIVTVWAGDQFRSLQVEPTYLSVER